MHYVQHTRKFRAIPLWSGVSGSIKNTAHPQHAHQLHHSAELRSNLTWKYLQLMCDQATQTVKPVWLHTISLVGWCLSKTMDTDHNFYYLTTFQDNIEDCVMQVFISNNFFWLAAIKKSSKSKVDLLNDLFSETQGLTASCCAYRAGEATTNLVPNRCAMMIQQLFQPIFERPFRLLRSCLYLHRQASVCVLG